MTLTEKIIELVPEIRYLNYGTEYQKLRRNFSPITLADVLRVIPIGVYMKSLGEQVRFVTYGEEGEELAGIEYWDLTTDLEGQSEETKAFLSKILGI